MSPLFWLNMGSAVMFGSTALILYVVLIMYGIYLGRDQTSMAEFAAIIGFSIFFTVTALGYLMAALAIKKQQKHWWMPQIMTLLATLAGGIWLWFFV